MDGFDILKKALENNDADRQKANEAVIKQMNYIQQNQDRFVTAGPVLGKHIDALIKNNEQLIRLAAEYNKLNPVMGDDDELGDEDLNDLYNNIQQKQ